MSIGLLSILLPFIVIPSLILGADLVVRSVRYPRGSNRNCWCGRCGYELHSLAQDRCPECGVAHALAGVLTPGVLIRQRGNYFLLWMGWSLLYPVLAVPVYALFLTVIAGSMPGNTPMRARVDTMIAGSFESMSDYKNRFEQRDEPPYGRNWWEEWMYKLNYTASTTTIASELTDGSVTLEFDRGTHSIEIDLLDGSWVMTEMISGVVTDSGSKFDTDALSDLFRSNGIDPDDPERVPEIDAIDQMIAPVVSDPTGPIEPKMGNSDLVRYQTYNGSTSNSQLPPLATFGWPEAVLVVILIGYVIGLILLFRRRARLLRATALH